MVDIDKDTWITPKKTVRNANNVKSSGKGVIALTPNRSSRKRVTTLPSTSNRMSSHIECQRLE